MGIADKFELGVGDIFDSNLELPEKVDGVLITFTLSTFISNYDMLEELFTNIKKMVKPDGYVLVTDFQYVEIPKDNFWAGMYTRHSARKPPGDFGCFDFIIDKSPDTSYSIINVPVHLMVKAAQVAGFQDISLKAHYPNPEIKNHPVVRRYLDDCKPNDYLLKLKLMNN